MIPLALTLDRSLTTPLSTQLSDQVRRLVVAGTLAHGVRLPSTRALAADLRCSRATVEQAYDQLVAEGWVEGRAGAGTFVASAAAPPPTRRARTPRTETRPLVHLDTGTPWIDPRHAAGWRRAWREVSAATPPRGYADPRGLFELREALAERLARLRGVTCEPDEIVVTAGTADGLRHLLGAMPAGPVAVEDPGYRAAVATIRRAGRAVHDLPAGRPVSHLGDAVGAYVTPAHQHPLARVMPATERLDLLAAAARADAVVIEDDYDSEFRYDVAPVPALAALDRDRVALLGTAAKAVAPSLRLGWLVAPPAWHEEVCRHRTLTHDAVSWPAQRAFLALLREGYVDKVVRTARRVYAERAPRVAAALAPYADQAGPSAGMYSTWLMPQERALRARAAAREAGFEVNLLADYCRSARLTGLVVGFGGVTDVELEQALIALVRGLD